jgi:MEDS: MEthanogen/methylotroph, DcmR Sensory domain
MVGMTPSHTDSSHFHAVRFYEDDSSLFRIVSKFISEGLTTNQPALVIATASHIEGITRNLRSAAIDVDAVQHKGDLLFVDARDMLNEFMVNGQPDGELFKASASAVIQRVCGERKRCTVRAYGEMVDVLWKDGMSGAAIKLEMLWNRLANTRDFSLLCGYSMGSFYKDASIEDITRQHTHIVTASGESAAVA